MPPLLQITVIVLVVGVIFVNGWTDAPNAIASVVATRTLRYNAAVRLAAACNLLGIVVMSLVNSSVADSITGMVNFGGDASKSLAALCAAMLSIVSFAVFAWWFGIPTSESHALIAALTGAAFAHGSAGGINPAAWASVLAGLALSIVMGFGLGFAVTRLLGKALQRTGGRFLDRLQIFSAGAMAFMHGAQDGQKFIAVFVIVDLLAKGRYYSGAVDIHSHLLVLALCAVVMALGTSVGGKRIIDAVGVRMVDLQKYQGVCANIGSALCLLLASLCGIPTSTTHTNTTAIMGAGVAAGKGQVDTDIMRGMFMAWTVTFPVCGLLGFGLTKLIVCLL